MFPKRCSGLIKSGNDVGYNFEILNSVININQNQKTILFPKIKNYFKGSLEGKRIAVWGLAFKPDTDDIREAPSLYLIEKLLESGAVFVPLILRLWRM